MEARIGGPWSKAFTALVRYGLEPQALTMLSHLLLRPSTHKFAQDKRVCVLPRCQTKTSATGILM